jgi:hypothetical protein
MRPVNRNFLRMLALAFVLGGSSVLGMACDNDSDAENVAEDIGDAVEDTADDVEDAVEDATE